MPSVNYYKSKKDIQSMSGDQAAAYIRELCSGGKYEEATKTFNVWTARHAEHDVDERGNFNSPYEEDVDLATVVKMEIIERQKVDDAYFECKNSQAQDNQDKSKDFNANNKKTKTPKSSKNKPIAPAFKKKAVDISTAKQSVIDELKSVPEDKAVELKGTCGNPLKVDPVPNYVKVDDDVIKDGLHNTSIVLGRDRNASRCSGYGGKGHTQAGAIDIVVGRLGYKTGQYLPDDDKKKRREQAWIDNSEVPFEDEDSIWANPDFVHDAARIYISQKSDIDDYFNLAPGRVGVSKTRSSIGMKADAVRIVARDGIKLVTRTDRMNSLGGMIEDVHGIDLIATNDDSDLQPIPKGANLMEAMQELTDHVSKLNGIVDSLLVYQNYLNERVTNHYHFGPAQVISLGGGLVWKTTPSPPVVAAGIKTMVDHLSQTKKSLIINKKNLATFKLKYLTTVGNKYINSRYNNTT
jgi:hypothetical protein